MCKFIETFYSLLPSLFTYFFKILALTMPALFGYFLGRMGKFKETRFDLVFKKYEKYDKFRNSWYLLFAIIANPDFLQLWNAKNKEHFENMKSATKEVFESKAEAGIYVSKEMEILDRYLMAKIKSSIVDTETDFQIEITQLTLKALVEEINSKLFFMEHMIKYECKTESYNLIMYKNFWESFLFERRFRKEARNWYKSKTAEFSEMIRFIDSYKSPFTREVGK